MYCDLGTMETIVRLERPYKVFQKANPTILRRYDIVRLAFFLYVKQCFTNIDLYNNASIGTLFALKSNFLFLEGFANVF